MQRLRVKILQMRRLLSAMSAARPMILPPERLPSVILRPGEVLSLHLMRRMIQMHPTGAGHQRAKQR